jgi:hypothetical protein
MTEAEWMDCDDPQKMLDFVHGSVSNRKKRLFLVACCRRIWHLLSDEPWRRAVEAAERLADGLVTEQQLTDVAKSAHTATSGRISFLDSAGQTREYWTSHTAFYTDQAVLLAATGDANAAVAAANSAGTSLEAKTPGRGSRDVMQARYAQERLAQCDLLRDLLGPLFSRDILVPSSVLRWNDRCVVKLATAIYEERDFTHGRMGVLADALEDARFANQEVLSHCRKGGAVHVRGCWCVDLLLGKL